MSSFYLPYLIRYKEDNFRKLREKRAPKALRGTSIGKDGGLRLLVDAEVVKGIQMGAAELFLLARGLFHRFTTTLTEATELRASRWASFPTGTSPSSFSRTPK